jgi:hypothetical protein
MKEKIIDLLDNFFDWLEEKNAHIGDLDFCSWVTYTNKRRKREFYLEPDCENCHFGWEYTSYEGECEDCGCCINYEFDTPRIYCALPRRIKKLIKKVKGWE